MNTHSRSRLRRVLASSELSFPRSRLWGCPKGEGDGRSGTVEVRNHSYRGIQEWRRDLKERRRKGIDFRFGRDFWGEEIGTGLLRRGRGCRNIPWPLSYEEPEITTKVSYRTVGPWSFCLFPPFLRNSKHSGPMERVSERSGDSECWRVGTSERFVKLSTRCQTEMRVRDGGKVCGENRCSHW